MLRGLHGLGLDEECALEAVTAGIVARHRQHRSHVFLLALHIGIQQTHISLASTPEDIAGAAQLNGGIDGVLDLHNGTCHDVEVRVRTGTVHVTLVAKNIGGPPEQLDAGLCLFLLQVGHDLLEVVLVFLDARNLGHEIYVVEAIVLNAQLLHEFKACIGLVLGSLQGI